MSSDPDDDALTWEGDDEQSRPVLPPGWKAVGRGSESADTAAAADTASSAASDATASDTAVAEATAGPGTAQLVAFGAIGGVYLLYTVGWLIGGLRLKPFANLLVADAMYLPWLIVAVAAPALWFLVAWVLTRRAAGWIRMALLIAGVVLLVPWPFVMMGAFGS